MEMPHNQQKPPDGLGEQRTHIGNHGGPISPGASEVQLQMRRNRSSAGSRMESRPASRPGGFFLVLRSATRRLKIGHSQIKKATADF